jgi:hypothetical protein
VTRWSRLSLADRLRRRLHPTGASGAPDDDADRLVRALQRHATEMLSPDPTALARMRSELLAAFDAAASGAEAIPAGADAAKPGTGAATGRARRRRWSMAAATSLRVRAAALVTAVAVLAGGAGVVYAASAPGGPLYTTRLDIEALTLPPAGTAAWYSAELGRLGARLSEAESATTADNAPAVEAAAQAYQAILSQTVTATSRSATGSNGDSSAGRVPPGLTRALDRHEAVLSALLQSAPAAAQPALRAALSQVGKAASAGQPEPAGPGVATGPQATAPAGPGRAGNPPGFDKNHARPSHGTAP